MNIPYRELGDYLPVDLERLRPKDSYKQLLAKRTHAIDRLVAQYGDIPADLLIARPCPSCAAQDYRDELRKDHMSLVRCALCDLVYVNPAFDQAHYREVYASADYQEIMRDLGIESHQYRVERFGSERVDLMSRFLLHAGPSPSYLDVGCSTGFVVEAAAARGWNAVGIDLNPSAIAFGCSRGLDLRVQALEDMALAAETFDAISLFDVLEHLLHPTQTLAAATRLLKPGGIVFLYVPNYDSASRVLMGADAHFIWPTHHLNYYTPATLGATLARHGLETELVVTEGLDIVDYIWHQREIAGQDVAAIERIADSLQFFINAGSYGKNLRLLARKTAAPART